MRFKKVFLLPIVLLGLTSCGGSNPDPGPQPEPEPPVVEDHTLNFYSTTCTMKDISGEAITSVKVKDGSSVNYLVSVNDPENYELPDDVQITGTFVSHTFEGGILSINTITSDIDIRATAKGIDEYTITYADSSKIPGFQWVGEKPATIKKGYSLSVGLKAIDDYTLAAENINVFVNTLGKLDSTKYSYSNNIFVLPAEYVVGDITITPNPVSPIPPIGTYEVIVTHNHSIDSPLYPFPSEQPKGTFLEGAFMVEKGYRAPTKTEIIKTGALHKSAIGIEHDFDETNVFYYETGVVDSEQYPQYGEYGYFYIYDYYELTNGDDIKIKINVNPIPIVTVIFDPGEGYWTDGTVGNKSTTIDKGDIFEKACLKAKANISVEDPARTFEHWVNAETKEALYSPTVIDKDTEAEAKFKDKSYSIFDSEIIGATMTNKPESVKWHEGVGLTDPKPLITVNKNNYRLPEKSGVTVRMGTGEDSRYLKEDEFIYNLSSDFKTATFGVKAGIIENNISVKLTATEEITVKFDPAGGTWPNLETQEVITVTCQSGLYTYNEIYASLETGGDPVKSGYAFDGWFNVEGGTKTPIPWDNIARLSITITATYTDDVDFENDSWANVVKYAKEGTLTKHYGNIIVGQERELFYTDTTSGLTYRNKVRVIGKNHDVLADGSGKKAALTFEFVDLIGMGAYGFDETPWGTSANNTWATSEYRTYMNKAYVALKACNEGFDVRPVKKKTMRGKDCGTFTPASILESDETLFPLSGSELGIPASNKEVNVVYYNFSKDWEGDMYEYYALGGYYVKKHIDEIEYSAYWLRSPHTDPGLYGDPDTGGAYYMHGNDTHGELGNYSKSITDTNSYGYMAAFCI